MIPGVFLRLVDALKARKFERMYAGQDPFHYSALVFEKRRIALMARLLSGRRYENAVEFGCAAGHVTLSLAPLCEKLLAVDLSQGAVDQAKERVKEFPHVSVKRGNLRVWRPAEERERFDLIVLSEILYYLGERNDLLKLFSKSTEEYLVPVLKGLTDKLMPGGVILLAHSHAAGQRPARERYRILLQNMGLDLKDEQSVPPTGEPGTDCCLVSLLERARI